MTKFETGKTYATRSLCDYDCIYRFEIVGRTAKTVKVKYHDRVTSRKVHDRDGMETIYPLGSYSMAPVLRASDHAERIAA